MRPASVDTESPPPQPGDSGTSANVVSQNTSTHTREYPCPVPAVVADHRFLPVDNSITSKGPSPPISSTALTMKTNAFLPYLPKVPESGAVPVAPASPAPSPAPLPAPFSVAAISDEQADEPAGDPAGTHAAALVSVLATALTVAPNDVPVGTSVDVPVGAPVASLDAALNAPVVPVTQLTPAVQAAPAIQGTPNVPAATPAVRAPKPAPISTAHASTSIAPISIMTPRPRTRQGLEARYPGLGRDVMSLTREHKDILDRALAPGSSARFDPGTVANTRQVERAVFSGPNLPCPMRYCGFPGYKGYHSRRMVDALNDFVDYPEGHVETRAERCKRRWSRRVARAWHWMWYE